MGKKYIRNHQKKVTSKGSKSVNKSTALALNLTNIHKQHPRNISAITMNDTVRGYNFTLTEEVPSFEIYKNVTSYPIVFGTISVERLATSSSDPLTVEVTLINGATRSFDVPAVNSQNTSIVRSYRNIKSIILIGDLSGAILPIIGLYSLSFSIRVPVQA
ncbi:hypothetical protein [Mechercharimyces sp. CAU 1602]|uniref:hypothetical protein n=1 Tax=Mechercharimyces sp. CAU 1602 TaxID=2973933 RepID=UPI002162AD70|nr:hypothetical protein [Mechercharimyces sp. CAU 1602]MCS1349986.1 hypothetical protein [Mechercharimyces sp. CAU 1602]